MISMSFLFFTFLALLALSAPLLLARRTALREHEQLEPRRRDRQTAGLPRSRSWVPRNWHKGLVSA